MNKYAIDAGHGCYPDTGAEGKLNEQDCALDIANRVIIKLTSLGHEAWNVRPTSVTSVTDSLQKRCDTGANADYFISIHLNCGGGRGSEVFAMSKTGNKLAQSVLNQLVSLGYVNRGVKDGSKLYVVKHSNPVAILIECCFVDSEEDANRYNPEDIANAIVRGLVGENSNTTTYISSNKIQQSIMALQYDFNKVFGSNLIVDGVVGTETINTISHYVARKGDKNDIVKWIQQKLMIWGYLPKNSDDGVFGDNTYKAVLSLQKNWGRVVDGVIGQKTWEIFLNN